ncbi:MAG: NAD+ synthase [Gammaproteobacteria bacterium]|nr:NAD+ synthase [Gammaproteobacteria bacterium]
MTAAPGSGGRVRFALAQLDFPVGDIDGNAARVIATANRARTELGADVVVFPELALTGYPPEDLLLRPELYRRVEAALAQVAAAVRGIDVILGYPASDGGRRYNSAVVLRDGVRLTQYRKQHLPNYGVFDEKRYFCSGESPVATFTHGPIRIAISICEDIWEPGTGAQARAAGAGVLVNLNASPYHLGKCRERQAVLRRNVDEGGVPILYLNVVGGQDELVFDGASMAMTGGGEIVYRGPHFEPQLAAIDVGPDGALSVHAGAVAPIPGDEESVYGALVLGVRDYVRKNGFNGAVLGLSGGIDSALTLTIAVDALGADQVEAVLMPSRYTAAMSVEDARLEATALGVACHVISIEGTVAAFNAALAPLFAGLANDVTEENIQARCRGVLLMAISNKKGRIVLATGNKSEMSVGYATLYGDMAGGFAPLKDVPKMLVYRLAAWRNTRGAVIPRRVIDRAPSAELRADQRDEDTLPPYPVLDAILERYIEHDQTPAQIVAAGFAPDVVARVARMVDRAEYKRRQAAPGVRVTRRAFGRERRFPITSGHDETR